MTRILLRQLMREPAQTLFALAALIAWWLSLAVALVILEAVL